MCVCVCACLCVCVCVHSLASQHMSSSHHDEVKHELITLSSSVSSCFLPPIVQRRSGGGGACEQGVVAVRKQEVMRPSDPAPLPLCEQQEKVQENRSLLEEVNNEITPLVSTGRLMWGEKLRPLEVSEAFPSFLSRSLHQINYSLSS